MGTTLAQLAGGARAHPEWAGIEITGLTEDSRKVEPGFLFAAVAGTATDGAHFIPDALRRGAAAVLAGPSAPVDTGSPVIRDANPRRAFARIAARYYASQPEIVVAVTGTSGKTSIVSFLRQIWESWVMARRAWGRSA